jgi:hypothetical protein
LLLSCAKIKMHGALALIHHCDAQVQRLLDSLFTTILTLVLQFLRVNCVWEWMLTEMQESRWLVCFVPEGVGLCIRSGDKVFCKLNTFHVKNRAVDPE